MYHLRDPFTQTLVLILFFAVVLVGDPATADEKRAIPHQTREFTSESPVAHSSAIERARQRIDQANSIDQLRSPGEVVVIYFTPRDRDPAPNHVDRIRRVIDEAAKFYEQELERHGFSGRSMSIRRNAADEVDVIDVVGFDTDYGENDGSRIRKEVVPLLRERRINPDRSVLITFCNLTDYDPDLSRISHNSPFYGRGYHLAGNAWLCDSEILAPKRIEDSTFLFHQGYGPISIGKYNSFYIGGAIHELGHAFSLMHCRQRDDQKAKGHALMGHGNLTYAQERRREGPGTFLTQANAIRLAAHPVFLERVSAKIYEQVRVNHRSLIFRETKEGEMRIEGQLDSNIPVHGMIAYFDVDGNEDYDATTACAVPDEQGRYSIVSGDLQSNCQSSLRLVSCHVNGATTTRKFRFGVDSEGGIDLTPIRLETELQSVIDALKYRGYAAAAGELEKVGGSDRTLLEIGNQVLNRFRDPAPAELLPLDSIGDDVRSIPLSHVKPESATVGASSPTYNAVPGTERLLSIDGDYFAKGIYAHAPARHEYELSGDWSRLTGRCGVQGKHIGKVEFIVRGDEFAMYRSWEMEAGPSKHFDIDVSGVEQLTLEVRSAGGSNGNLDAWGVWIEPELSR
ncbi:NPCBM/NEW2 domain-containing protein [Roseiconus lacunae]|uniref:NPCBM/NEW2 domain-containing protein n=1 Tax=Roseiconus lacunae TaxID=2605694 RepID=A0ABT7PNP3_9BACT|nr:NPCBM/NEW2 domain-containing protein [Roseiconus lacunae]MDM4018133.1 NPCBM/NEW2 domain-containing protein [Roseiconus lacunae]